MNSRVAAGGPASAHLHEKRVVYAADVDLPLRSPGTGHLRMTAQAKVRITLREHFAVHRTVRTVASRAAFSQRRMLEHDGACLFPMTLRAAFIPSGHGQSARRFEDVAAVGIVALDAIHPAFEHRMMVRRFKFAPGSQMTLQTGSRILARIDDELDSAACSNVLAAGPVTGFASGIVFPHAGGMNAGMGAGWKALNDRGVAVQASLVADFMRPWNDQRHINRPVVRGTGTDRQNNRDGSHGQRQRAKPRQALHCGKARQWLGWRTTRS